MDSTKLIAEANSLLEQNSERLKQANSRQDSEISRDTLVPKFKAALSAIQRELQEERTQRQHAELQLSSCQSLCQSLQSSLLTLQSQFDESLRAAVRKKENEIRDQCALREAQLKVELRAAVAQLEEELEAAEGKEVEPVKEELERERGERRRLEGEVEQLKGRLRAEMEKRLRDKADYKAVLEKQRAALKVKLASKADKD